MSEDNKSGDNPHITIVVMAVAMVIAVYIVISSIAVKEEAKLQSLQHQIDSLRGRLEQIAPHDEE